MKVLMRRADLLLPNVTEAALLTGLPYGERQTEQSLAEMTGRLLSMGPRQVLITGVSTREGQIGFFGQDEHGNRIFSQRQEIPRRLHGTGDLFSAAAAGCLLRGQSLGEAGALAAEYVYRCVEATPEVTPFGAEFEKVLPWLGAQCIR